MFALPWNYYDEDYDPATRQKAVERGLKALQRLDEQDEMDRTWKAFRKERGMAHWP